jgi:5S rRNA maturation endonuclease (ribonuclease M5)
MRISDLTPAEIRNYFEQRLGAQFRGESVKQVVRCPFHQDKKPSLSIDLSKGVWNCFTGCGKGGLIDFEQKFNGGLSRTDALAAIHETLGLEFTGSLDQDTEPEAIYPYTDEHGKLLFQKMRFPGKRFSQRKIGENGEWVYNLGKVRKPLYNLQALITANQVIVTEGEKDADNVNRLALSSLDESRFSRIMATTNFDGAGHWDPLYSRYFAGKDVAIFPDFDDPGRHHAATVAASVYDYAASVKVVELPGLPPKGDISDYLEAHGANDLIEEIQKAPLWVPKKSELIVSASEFLRKASLEIEWLVEGLVQKGANGFIVSDPKGSKSWLAVDMALALCLAQPWLGFQVNEKTKVALITREDNPALTKWRLRRLLEGRNATEAMVDDRLYVNSKDQSPQFKLDVPEQLAEMMSALKALKPDFVILDVLNILHSADENDNTEMRKVLDHANLISTEVKCSICVLHHFNKDAKNGRLTQRIRGAGALAGWVEWVIGLHRVSDNTDDPSRWAEFELKAASAPNRVYFSIRSDDTLPETVIVVDDPPIKKARTRGGLA